MGVIPNRVSRHKTRLICRGGGELLFWLYSLFSYLMIAICFFLCFKTSKFNEDREKLIQNAVTVKLRNLFQAATPLREVFDLPRRVVDRPENTR